MRTRQQILNKGSRPRGQMNITETAWSNELTLLRAAGEIRDFWYEPVNFRLTFKGKDSKAAFYSPDFMIITTEGQVMFDEVKGSQVMNEASKLAVKTVAERYPDFIFRMVLRKRGGWNIMEM